MPTKPAAVLEIHQSFGSDTAALPARVEKAFALFD